MTSALQPDSAWLLAVDRDQAKSLFAAQSDEELVGIVARLTADETLAESGLGVNLGQQWQSIQLGLDALQRDANDDALAAAAAALLGGRRLSQGKQHLITLQRPDMAPHVGAALKQLGPAHLQAMLQEPAEASDSEQNERETSLRNSIATIADLYAKAAASRRAVVFATQVS